MEINDLFKVIDDQLLILSEARRQGRYKWFDFVCALNLLNGRIQDEGYNEYRTRKVSQLVNVFNDLCQTIVQSCSLRVLAYNKDNKIATTEWHILGKDSRVETIESPVISGLENYYEQLSLPERELHSADHLKTTKIKYLLMGCTEDSKDLVSIYYPDSDETDSSMKSFIAEWSAFALRHYQLLNEKRGDFNEIFKIDSNTIYKYRISFEEYVTELKAERHIIFQSQKAAEMQTQCNSNEIECDTTPPAFSPYLLSDIHKLCDGALFDPSDVSSFQNIMNDPLNNSSKLSIRKGERIRTYHLISELTKCITDDTLRRRWLNGILNFLGIKEQTYNSKYQDVQKEDTNTKNINFRNELKKIIDRHNS